MANVLSLRQRKSVAQLYAVSGVERQIRAADLHPRRKYLRDFTEAFQTYRGPLSSAELLDELLDADILLVGDYHALPACQLYAATLVQQLASAEPRPLVLALEAVFVRDQRLLDQWQSGQADERELRDGLRFDRQWGFPWQPFFRLLCAARSAGARIYGLDCAPRGNLRRIAARDEHAAERIAAIAGEAPARIVVLFGESHLAPQHLPALVRRKLPVPRTLTLLQNIDPLYWKAEGESGRRIEAVRVSDDVLCVFNASPLEKYESYRQCLQRWRQERPSEIDLTPTFYNLITALLRFLGIEDTRSGTPHWLTDLFPQVNVRPSAGRFRQPLQRTLGDELQVRELLRQIERDSCAYVAETNRIYARRFEMPGAAAAAARFVHAACSGRLASPASAGMDSPAPEDRFYALCVNAAIAEFGARILHSARQPVTEQELYSRYTRERGELESEGLYSYRDQVRMIDFIVLHRDFECNARRYRQIPELIGEGRAYSGDKLRFVTGVLGQLLGTQFYQSYLDGRVDRRYLRSLYFRRLQRPGEPKLLYFQLARRTRKLRRRLAA